MRKLAILLALAGLTATSSGCAGCLGRCRNFFHKGSPCGTSVAPAVLGAPLAMGTPISQPAPMMTAPLMAAPMAQPMVMSQGVCCDPCVPCDPCADPCGSVTMGYGSSCCDGGAPVEMSVPAGSTYLPTAPATPGAVVPQPMAE